MDRNSKEYRWAVAQVRKDPRSEYCFLTGEKLPEGGGDIHHCLPVSLFPEYACRKVNLVVISRKAHNIIHGGTTQEIARLPRIHHYLARLRTLDVNYYEQLYDKLRNYLTAWNV